MNYRLRIAGREYRRLRKLLYLGDGLEAGAIALCGRLHSDRLTVLLVQSVHEIPADAYTVRESDFLEYRQEWMTDLINDAEARDLSIVRFHSHPGGYASFSDRDDATDLEVLGEWAHWFNRPTPHGSAVMLPSGEIFARALHSDGALSSAEAVSVSGDRLQYWPQIGGRNAHFKAANLRNAQAFGEGTTQTLNQLKIAVVGCSGTGSVVVEQLARLGVGHLVIVDPDVVEEKNLNRILNAMEPDALAQRSKVHVAKTAIERMGFGTIVTALHCNLIEPDAIRAVASCDVVFGCVDGAEGRHVLNRLATYYVLPFFDVGVALRADGDGGISEITGAVHFLQPGGSSLLSRGVYTLGEVEAETMCRLQPELYAERRKQNYIAGVNEERPAVLPVNMHFASLMVLEFLARLHGYRYGDEDELAVQQYNLEDPDKVLRAGDGEPCAALSNRVGRGDVVPLLDLPMLAER